MSGAAGRSGAELARFLAVAVAGLAVDLGVAAALAGLAGVGLVWAAAAGFAAGAGLNYVLHELWTFRDGARQLSAARLLRYGGALAATLAARLAVVAGLDAVLADPRWDLPILAAAAGVSFGVNYLASKLFVFTRATVPAESDP